MKIKTKSNIAKVLAVASLATTLAPSITFAAEVTNDVSANPVAVTTNDQQEVQFNWGFTKGDEAATLKIMKGKELDALKGLTLVVSEKGKTTQPKKVFEIGTNTVTDTNEADKVSTIKVKDGTTQIGDKEFNVELKVTPGTEKVKLEVTLIELNSEKKPTDKKTVLQVKELAYEKVAETKPMDATETETAQAKKFAKDISVEANQGKIIAKIPAVPTGLKATVVFKNTEVATAADIEVKDLGAEKTVEIGKVAEKNNYSAKVVVTRAKDGLVIGTYNPSYKLDLTKAAPVVNYAYVIDGALVINATSKAGMAQTPLFWKYSYEKDFRAIAPDFGYGYSYRSSEVSNERKANFDKLFGKTTYNKYTRLSENDYRLPIEIPCKLQMVFVDALGNKTPVSLTINEDNVILTGPGIGKAPEEVGKLIKSVTDDGTFESVREKDLLVVKKDTTVNLYETFKSLLQKEWDSFNSRELNWTCDQFSNFDAYRLKFNKEGKFDFEVTKDGSKGKVTFTVLVMDGKNNVKSFKVLKDVKVNGDKFQAIKGFEFKTTDGKDANPTGFYAKYDGKYYRLTDEIPFATEKNKNAKEAVVTIKDVQNNKNYEVKFIQASATKIPLEKARTMFSDLKGHWSENRVVTLVANGVISGYPDGTFKPDNMISARETLAIIGRFGQTLNKEKVNAVVNDKVEFAKANWGNEDVEWVLKRLPQNIFAGQDLDKQLTREQVAYIMNHVFKYATSTATTSLSDIGKAKYQTEINQLVSAGTIKGYPDGTFKPDLPITRAELCSMMFTIPGVQYDVIAQGTTAPATTNTPAKKDNTKKVDSLDELFK